LPSRQPTTATYFSVACTDHAVVRSDKRVPASQLFFSRPHAAADGTRYLESVVELTAKQLMKIGVDPQIIEQECLDLEAMLFDTGTIPKEKQRA
jgi:hypothetical protein